MKHHCIVTETQRCVTDSSQHRENAHAGASVSSVTSQCEARPLNNRLKLSIRHLCVCRTTTTNLLPERVRRPRVENRNVVGEAKKHEHEDNNPKPYRILLRYRVDIRRRLDQVLLWAVTVKRFPSKLGRRMTPCECSVPRVSVPFPHTDFLQGSRESIAKPNGTRSSVCLIFGKP